MSYIEMYEATFKAKYLRLALVLFEKMHSEFWDYKNGGYYVYGNSSEQLITRPKEVYDGAIPSGNSVITYCISKLYKLTFHSNLNKILEKQIKFITSELYNYPYQFSFSLIALMTQLYEYKELICVVKDDKELDEIKEILNQDYNPNITTIAIRQGKESEFQDISNVEGYNLVNEELTFYLCKNNTCSAPFQDIRRLKSML